VACLPRGPAWRGWPKSYRDQGSATGPTQQASRRAERAPRELSELWNEGNDANLGFSKVAGGLPRVPTSISRFSG
jgi:hypothetical protein